MGYLDANAFGGKVPELNMRLFSRGGGIFCGGFSNSEIAALFFFLTLFS